jgi:hypothetical protein
MTWRVYGIPDTPLATSFRYIIVKNTASIPEVVQRSLCKGLAIFSLKAERTGGEYGLQKD